MTYHAGQDGGDGKDSALHCRDENNGDIIIRLLMSCVFQLLDELSFIVEYSLGTSRLLIHILLSL